MKKKIIVSILGVMILILGNLTYANAEAREVSVENIEMQGNERIVGIEIDVTLDKGVARHEITLWEIIDQLEGIIDINHDMTYEICYANGRKIEVEEEVIKEDCVIVWGAMWKEDNIVEYCKVVFNIE